MRVTTLSSALIALFLPSLAVSDPRAVAGLHYQASVLFTDTDYRHSDSKAHRSSGSAAVTMPLSEYIGATLSGGYSTTHIKTEPKSCNLDSSAIGVGVFARDYEIGKLGLSHDKGRGEWCGYDFITSTTLHGTIDTAQTTAVAAYYFPRVTVGATRSWVRTSGGLIQRDEDYTADSFAAQYYPLSNLSVGLGTQRSRSLDTHSISLEYQPDIFAKAASVSFSFAKQEYANTVILGVTYFFDNRYDLITRDRRYR